MNRFIDPRGHFHGTVIATQSTNTLVGRVQKKGSTYESEQKYPIE